MRASALPKTVLPSPGLGRVGVHDFAFEACSGFTRVTARRFAQAPKAPFIAGLRPEQSPSKPPASYRANRPLPGWDLHPLGDCALQGAPKPGQARPS